MYNKRFIIYRIYMNIYKVNYLTGVNRIQKIYVFSGDQDNDLSSLFEKEPTNPIFTKIFNSQELSYIQSQKIENRQYKNILNFQEIDDFFSTWCAKNNISSVIVRPDRYVYGIANNKSDLKNIFKDFNFFLTRK